jgi:hypothetical protein
MYIFVIVRFAATLSTASKGQDMHALLTCSVSQNRTYTPYMTSSLVISLPKILLIHCIYMYGSGQPFSFVFHVTSSCAAVSAPSLFQGAPSNYHHARLSVLPSSFTERL